MFNCPPKERLKDFGWNRNPSGYPHCDLKPREVDIVPTVATDSVLDEWLEHVQVVLTLVESSLQESDRGKTTPQGFPVHSFPTLLGDLASLVLNRVTLLTQENSAITIATKPTQLQRRAFDLLGVDPQQNVSITVTG